jgi:hypothetical protein
MSHLPKAVVIVNFDFPPNQGIGGRRWAKLAKGLANRGVNVFVIKADPIFGNKTSPWTKDVQHPLIKIHSIPRTYPQSVSHPRKGWKHKFRYLWDINVLRRNAKGTIYDVAIGWNYVLDRKLIELVSANGITHVIATGAPFNALYYCALFKKNNPNIKLIVDYRDPWLTAKNYGMPSLDSDAMSFEIEKQNQVFRHADLILSPYKELTDRLFQEASSVSSDKSKFKVLPHFYDESDSFAEGISKSGDGPKLTLVYGGALYTGTSETLRDLKNYLTEIEQCDEKISKRLIIKIFTDNLIEASIFNGVSNVLVSPTIGKQIFDELRNADFCMIMAAEHNKNQLTTKFFEYLPLRKPIVYLGPEGEISRFLESNSLGFRISNFASDFPKLINDFDSGEIKFNRTFDVSSFTLNASTEILLSFLP